jgi:hypothetical protein
LLVFDALRLAYVGNAKRSAKKVLTDYLVTLRARHKAAAAAVAGTTPNAQTIFGRSAAILSELFVEAQRSYGSELIERYMALYDAIEALFVDNNDAAQLHPLVPLLGAVLLGQPIVRLETKRFNDTESRLSARSVFPSAFEQRTDVLLVRNALVLHEFTFAEVAKGDKKAGNQRQLYNYTTVGRVLGVPEAPASVTIAAVLQAPAESLLLAMPSSM